jgi:two-component system chemotaxis response regulator CheB
MKKIRVLVVDDSAFMRKWLSEMINSDAECEVIKASHDGVEALRDVEKLRPDVVTMDIELPEIDGLTCVAYIMEDFPTPVVMVTGFSKFMGEETIKALEYGAVGLVRKPKRLSSQNIKEINRELLSNIKLASRVEVKKLTPVKIQEVKDKDRKPIVRTTNKIVAIASSSGGPRALSQVIPKLSEDLHGGTVVVQHIPAEFVSALAERLNHESILSVKVAEDQEPIQQGKVLVAPPNSHCTIASKEKEGEFIKLIPFSKQDRYPLIAADKLMISLAPIYGKNATGVILTGMGNDGTEGFRSIKKYGGHTITEDKSTCMVYGMPKSAIEAGVVDRVVPLHRIAEEIIRVVNRQ